LAWAFDLFCSLWVTPNTSYKRDTLIVPRFFNECTRTTCGTNRYFLYETIEKNKSLKQNFQLIHSELSEQLKTKMNKNKIIISLSIGLLIAAIVACTSLYNNDDNNTSRISAEKRAEIELVGVLHNQWLDSILVDFWRDKIQMFQESPQSPQLRAATIAETYDYEQLVYNTIKRLMKESGFVQSEQELQAVMPEQLLKQITHVGTRAAEFNEAVMDQCTPFQAEYYNRLMNILHREDITLDLFLSEIAVLEKQIEKNAPTLEEAEQLLYATSVARHSAEYWYENMEMWYIVLSSDMEMIVSNDAMASFTVLKQLSYPTTRYTTSERANFRPNPLCICSYLYSFSITDHEGYTTTTNSAIGHCPNDMYFHPEQEVCVHYWEMPEALLAAGCMECYREKVNGLKAKAWDIAGWDAAGAATGGKAAGWWGALGIGVVASGSAAFSEIWSSMNPFK
jgi:hypothetical protein